MRKALRFKTVKGKRELYKIGTLFLIEQAGGQLQMIEQIKEARKRGDLTKKQAFDLRKLVNEVCKEYHISREQKQRILHTLYI